ncbi:MAG TPA: single-stranded DNA-binding protein [Chthoniobacterales bacterium]|jgi:single-strand DNA-binding protein
MASVNKVILIGNLTRDPEIKYTPKGTAVTDLGLAVNRFIPASEGGEKREETTFIDVTLWGRTAEVAHEYAKKGQPLYVEGRLQMDTWDDKQTGQKRSKLKVVGENIQLLGTKGGGGGRSSGGDYDDAPPSRPPQRSAPPASRPPAEPEDDDIPF